MNQRKKHVLVFSILILVALFIPLLLVSLVFSHLDNVSVGTDFLNNQASLAFLSISDDVFLSGTHDVDIGYLRIVISPENVDEYLEARLTAAGDEGWVIERISPDVYRLQNESSRATFYQIDIELERSSETITMIIKS